MRLRLTLACAAALILAAPAFAQTAPAAAGPTIAEALADPARPAEERARDAARKPAEILALAEVKPGQKVVDLVMGGGYFTRILAKAVGPAGKVYAYQPQEFITFAAKYGESSKVVAAAYPNVEALVSPFADLAIPGTVDLVLTVQNYHDFYLKPFPADTATSINRKVFEALKPGGVYLVVDHHAQPGTGTTAADSLHRIDAEAVKSEVAKAGFVLEAESPLLRQPADPRTANVFDPAIRGKTDQFILKFRKPG